MFEKISQCAEEAATSVSRRQMLGRVGRAAAAAAAMLAGLLPSQAEAGRKVQQCVNCYYLCPDGSSFAVTHHGRGCPGKSDGCKLESATGCGV